MLPSTLRTLGETVFVPAVISRSLSTARRRRVAVPSALYRTPTAVSTSETEVKKSRFVALAAPCTSPEDALTFIKERGDPQASHNCWAFRLGESVYRFSDDGEPGGTAGQPILQALNTSGLDYCVVLVTRYYGGTQLGTGGLIRAYGGAAQLALEAAAETSKEVRAKVDAVVNCSPQDLGSVYLALDEFAALKIDEEYSDDGSVHMQIEIEEGVAEELKDRVLGATSGRADFKWWPAVQNTR